jgi:predicted acyltransferase
MLNSPSANKTNQTNRLASLDIFRGLTIAGMILVNNPGSGSFRFTALAHSQWHGCTPADLIFPFFVFIVGVSAVFSLGTRLTKRTRPLEIYQHILSRTGTLFFLGLFGLFLSGWLFQAVCPPADTQKSIWALFLAPPTDTDAFFYSLGNLRLPGVLQRLALVYLAVSVLTVHARWRAQAIIVAALLLAYWGLMTLTGFALEPGADLGAWIDRAVFGQAHLYLQTWDPEGLLSTLPAIATGLCGALTGHWLRSRRPARNKIMGLFLFGLLGIAVGALWGLVFPLNKNLWTSSFVLYTAGCALITLGLLYWLVDLKKVPWANKPFAWLGTRPLFAYCGSQVAFLALYTLYIGTPAEHTNLLLMILNGLFHEHWDIIGLTSWPDPRWPSLYWALLCLIFWTLLMGLFGHRPNPALVPVRETTTRTARLETINPWDQEHIAGGYVGG